MPDLLLDKFGDGEQILATTYSGGETAGVSILVVISCFSLVAVVGLLVIMAASAWSNRASPNKNYFFRTNMAVYFIALLVSDLVQACASIMNARWVLMGGVHSGKFCTAQAVLKHMTDLSPALWTFVISAQTFCLLFYQLHSPRWMAWAVLGLVIGLIAFLTLLGPAIYKTKTGGDFYGITGYWCWISPEYDLPRATLAYMILFLSAFLSLVFYTLVFFRLRGNIIVTGWHLRFRMLRKDNSAQGEHEYASTCTLTIAKQMIIYPFAYTILFLPIAILRMCEWAGHPASFVVTIFCDSVFLMSGMVNVLLFCTIQRVIPIKEVTIGLVTGRIFQRQEKSLTEASWFAGSIEDGEKPESITIVPAATEDSFLLRQPKFEIIIPPQAVLPNHESPPRTTSLLRPSLGEPAIYGDGDERCEPSSFSRDRFIRKLPPIPRVPRPGALPPIAESEESPLAPYCPAATRGGQHSVSKSARAHNHSLSIDSTTSDTTKISGPILFGPAGGEDLGHNDSSNQV